MAYSKEHVHGQGETAFKEHQRLRADGATLHAWATLINAFAPSQSLKTTLIPLLEQRVALTSDLRRLDEMESEYNVLEHTIEALRQYDPTFAGARYDQNPLQAQHVARVTVWGILLHDHGKVEGIHNGLHQQVSARIAKSNFLMLQDVYTPEFASQVVRLVGNHHIFEGIYNGTIPDEEAHMLLPTVEDVDIMYSMTLADLYSYTNHHQYIPLAKEVHERLLKEKTFGAFTFEPTQSGDLGADS